MASRPHRTETRVVASYPFLELREHDLEEDGAPPRRVVTIHLADWAIVCALTPSGELVLVRQHRHGVDAPSLELPGGLIDPGELPEKAARRELLEETGYSSNALVPLGWVHVNPALHDNRAFYFLANDAEKIAAPEERWDERLEIELMNERDLSAAIAAGSITHAFALLGIAKAREHRAKNGESQRTAEVSRVLDEMERHQRDRVVALARRLRPNLTMEDIASPHDFPELDDPDWHFEDGQLAAIQAVRYALMGRGPKRDSDAKED